MSSMENGPEMSCGIIPGIHFGSGRVTGFSAKASIQDSLWDLGFLQHQRLLVSGDRFCAENFRQKQHVTECGMRLSPWLKDLVLQSIPPVLRSLYLVNACAIHDRLEPKPVVYILFSM